MGSGDNRAISPAVFYITGNGRLLAEKIGRFLPGAEVIKFSAPEFEQRWDSSKQIICVMAAGIVVRVIAPLLKDKVNDPAVLVLDEKGRHVISLLSGHIGGANKLAEDVAGFIGAQAVVTTASDVQGRTALDLWAVENDLYIEDFERMKRLGTKIVNGEKISVRPDCPFDAEALPAEFVIADSDEKAELVITHRTVEGRALFLRPKILFAGVGCNRGTSSDEIEAVLNSVLSDNGLSVNSVGGVATIDIKQDEAGLLGFVRRRPFELMFFSKDELNRTAEGHGLAGSDAVEAATGALGVAEPSALLAAQSRFDKAELIIPKQKRGNVTLAIAKAEFTL